MMTKEKKQSKPRRLLLMVVGYLSFALDKLEGKSTESPDTTKTGRIEIVE
jgi:hypothetical protein